MQGVVVVGVKDGQEDEAHGAEDGKEDGEAHEDLLAASLVGDEAALVAKPALGGKGEVKGDGGEGGAGDEEGLELEGANVADVGQAHVALLGGQVAAVMGDEPPEEHAEEHAEPDGAGQQGEPLERFHIQC